MPRTSCLAGIDGDKIAILTSVLRKAGAKVPSTTAQLNVAELGKLEPGLIVCDIDRIDVDALEVVRRLRFVLPDCIIAVYTELTTRAWAMACHLAGANCLLSKNSSEAELSLGLRGVLRTGCFTDPRIDAA
jgi:DNA-binding NarL/FixJ family response regulator